MQTLRIVHWQEDDAWLGYLHDFPDYLTQADSLDELRENLLDLYRDLTSGAIPAVRRIDEIQVP